MSIPVEVGLLSGKTALLTVGLDEEVGTLGSRAQSTLGVGRGRLLNSSGSILDASTSIKEARVQDGDSLTSHISQLHLKGFQSAFAAILGDGSVMTWGAVRKGGDSSEERPADPSL